jgi:hypothetical protein
MSNDVTNEGSKAPAGHKYMVQNLPAQPKLTFAEAIHDATCRCSIEE